MKAMYCCTIPVILLILESKIQRNFCIFKFRLSIQGIQNGNQRRLEKINGFLILNRIPVIGIIYIFPPFMVIEECRIEKKTFLFEIVLYLENPRYRLLKNSIKNHDFSS